MTALLPRLAALTLLFALLLAPAADAQCVQLGPDLDGEAGGDFSGISVSLSGDRVAIGAPLNDGTAADAGHVRVYEYAASASAAIAITSVTSTIERGRSVFFRGPLTNTGSAPLDAYVYYTVDVPGLGTYQKNLRRKTLAPGETINYRVFRKNFVPLPPDAPAGTYTVTVFAASDNAGTTVYDSDSFQFTLPPLDGLAASTDGGESSLEFATPEARPNPFRDATTIRYSLAAAGEVDLRVYDVTGREVASLVSGTMSAGTHAATLRAGDLPGGVYVWRLAIGGEVTTGRVTLAR